MANRDKNFADGFKLFLGVTMVLAALIAPGNGHSEIAVGKDDKEGDTAMKCGIASTVITPKEPSWMAGWHNRLDKKSEGVYSDLIAQAVVFEESGRRVAIVCADILAFEGPWSEAIRKKLDDLGIIPGSNLLLNASHTHCGPVLETKVYSPYPEYINPGYCDWLSEEIVKLVCRAADSMFECELFYATAPCSVGISRRRLDSDGRSLGISPTILGEYDENVRTLRIKDKDGKNRAILFCYGCHPAAMAGYLMGPDWVGYARDYLEEQIPECEAIYLQGFEGDQRPRNLNGKGGFATGTVEDLKMLGWQMAQSVLATLTIPGREIEGTGINGILEKVDLPLRKLPTRSELEEYRNHKNKFTRTWAEQMLSILDEQGSLSATLPMPIQIIRIGGFLCFGMAGEVCIPYMGILEKLSGDSPAFFAGCSNSCVAYIPSDAMLPQGGYEASSNYTVYFYPAPFSPGVEGAIVDGFSAILKRMF